jgi:ribose transport system ATP-binding protein
MMNCVIDALPAAPAAAGRVLIELKRVSKRYPGVNALTDVDFELRAGEVHVLFGENGAGKSTLISLISGAARPSSGSITFREENVDLASVHDARSLGICAVFQEFSLIPQLTVEENIFLGESMERGPFIDRKGMRERALRILEELQFPLRPEARVVYLSRAEQQMVEIAKAFRSKPSILILDEPTASLTEAETDRLFFLIEKAKKEGVGIIYITHRMAEIKRIGDRITVLRDGRKVKTLNAAEVTESDLVQLMTGRVITQIFPKVNYQPGAMRLAIRGLTTAGQSVCDTSIHVRAGEIVGIAGLIGSGKSEIGRACFGLEKVTHGAIEFNGEDVTGKSIAHMLDRGLFYLTSNRRDEGLVMVRNVRENMSLPALVTPEFSSKGFLRLARERRHTKALCERTELSVQKLEGLVEHLSGGNQQKVMLARALTRDISFFIFDEPTVGVDVGTRVAIYEFIRTLCEQGAGVLLISSDLPEILHLTNRAYVMHRGELRAELQGAEITQENVLRQFFDKGTTR